MSKPVISVENLSKSYQLGQIDTGTFSNDLKVWWARMRGKPNPLLRIGEADHGNRVGEELWALKDVSFIVEHGEVMGIIGRNGAGKSTLLKILSRVTAPTSGSVKVKGRIASLLEVGTGFHPELTGRENIFLNGAILGMTKQEVTRKFDEIVDFSEISKFIDTPVKRYSSGMYVRLAFAVAAHLDPEILIIDEVLAVGDIEFQNKCIGKIGEVSKAGRTVLFVSHNMASISNLCTSTLILSTGRVSDIGPTEVMIENFLKQSKHLMDNSIRDLNHFRPDWAIPIITSVKLLDNKKEERSTFPIGSDLIFQVTFHIDSSIFLRMPNLGIIIHHETKGIVGGINQKMSGSLKKYSNLESGKLICTLKNPPLLQGKYSVDIWFGDGTHDYDNLNGCISFDLEASDVYRSGVSPYSNLGIVYFQADWKLDDLHKAKN